MDWNGRGGSVERGVPVVIGLEGAAFHHIRNDDKRNDHPGRLGAYSVSEDANECKPEVSREDSLECIQGALEEFLRSNPQSTVEYFITSKGKKKITIKDPWGDNSLRLAVSNEDEDLCAALNSVVLPPRFTAIWHKDTKDFEVIYTAFKLGGPHAEIIGRSFCFKYNGRDYICEFGPSSDRLLLIAQSSLPVSETITEWRNLQSFVFYCRQLNAKNLGEQSSGTQMGEPISFWIRGVEWNEEQVINMVRHLNFYMSYYDTFSPSILIHTPEIESVASKEQIRYRSGGFPNLVSARSIDENMLHFWAASRSGDPLSRFIVCFRIIEYTAFSFLDFEVRLAARRLLAAPNALENISKTTEELVALLQSAKLDDYAKFGAVIRDIVDPKLLWGEILNHIEGFNTELRFDGGFCVPPLVVSNWNEKDFAHGGMEKFIKTARDIRNALSHGRDQRTAFVITPTPRNMRLLQPWALLMAVAAGEVMLYRGIQA
jgi:hypothetical protein